MDKKPSEPAAGARFVEAWNRFWFTPGDPTVLALIRIFCGMVTLYTFIGYSFDLQALLGEHAWMDLETRQRMYRETPQPAPERGWLSPRLERPKEPGWHQKYYDAYTVKHALYPPPPWPKDEQKAQRIDEYMARWGIDPRLTSGQGQPSWSIWLHITDPTAMVIVQTGIVLISFLFLIGFCTRVMGPLTWAAALCYTHRAAASVFGVDTMMVILLLYLAIGPSGAALSVDRLIGRWWARARPRVLARWRALWGRPAAAPAVAAPFPDRPVASVSANLAIRLLQIHVCIIYASAGLAKLQGPMWWNGTAVWYVLANYEFAPMQYWPYLGLLRFLGKNRWLFELTMTGAGLFTLFFEIAYAFLIWKRSTRWLILWMAILLHGFIGLFMGLKTFSLMMLAMNLAFVPPETARRLLGLVSGRAGRSRPGAPPEREDEAKPEREAREVAQFRGKVTR